MIPARIRLAIAEETTSADVRLTLCLGVSRLLPTLLANRLRTNLVRLGGVTIGRGTTIGGRIMIYGANGAASLVRIGRDCWINADCTFDASDRIDVGDRVAIGQQVLVLTNSHHIGTTESRAGRLHNQPVSIGPGSWIGARSVILPGTTLGAGCIVAAGSVVNRSVPPNSLVGGVPARLIRRLGDLSLS
ncbi:MAG: acyltransferase [Ilumatobacteraceae bacterium]